MKTVDVIENECEGDENQNEGKGGGHREFSENGRVKSEKFKN